MIARSLAAALLAALALPMAAPAQTQGPRAEFCTALRYELEQAMAEHLRQLAERRALGWTGSLHAQAAPGAAQLEASLARVERLASLSRDLNCPAGP